jgi:hypothetical protein
LSGLRSKTGQNDSIHPSTRPRGNTPAVKIRTLDWKILSTWAAGLTLGVLCLAWVMRVESARQLQHSAEAAGLRWASFASRTVPDLDTAFANRVLTPAAREQLLRLRKADSVFRFKLFDPIGNLLLVSDDLERSGPELRPDAAGGIGADHNGGNKAYIRDKVLSGVNHIDLKREQRADRPGVYSEAYVPVLRDGRVLGVVEVYVDQVEEAPCCCCWCWPPPRTSSGSVCASSARRRNGCVTWRATTCSAAP